MSFLLRAVTQPGILVVDNDHDLATALQDLLIREGYSADVAFSAPEALRIFDENPGFGLALVDLAMPFIDGMALMEELHHRNPELPVVVTTAAGAIENAVGAIRHGAEDYLTKPFDRDAVCKKVDRLMELRELRRRVAQLQGDLEGRRSAFEPLVHVSRQMHRLVERAQAAAGTDAPVLLLGEAGTGKELLARAMHRAGRQADAPFVAINCAALARELPESEFGLRRAYASGGTVFLDEIRELPREVQARLLRLLEEGELRAPDAAKTVCADARLIAATSRSLHALRSEFLREDLYFRIATIVLEMPPLRERPEDILVLAQHFVARLSEKHKRQIVLNRGAMELLLKYPFPGNVRELEELVESVAPLAHDNPQMITERDLKPRLRDALARSGAGNNSSAPLAMEDVERMAVERALRTCGGNRTRAARLLGISRDTLYRRLKEVKSAG